jgi:exopolysaccharide production protein ExoZ
MEGMRGFAVFLVFLVHYVTLINPWIATPSGLQSFANALHTVGNTGVDLFFVLSGYLIYGSLISRSQPFLRFMSRRVQRIYPAFLVVFAAYAALSFIFPALSRIPASGIAATIYLLQNIFLLPGLFSIEPLITVAWSLSYEMFYYLTIPLVIAAFALRLRSTRWRVVFFAVIATAGIGYCAAFGGHIRLVMFVSGILLHEAINIKRLPAPGSALALAALVIGLLGTLLPLYGASGYALKVTILFVSFFFLCLSCFRYPTMWLARAFSWTPLRWLGNMSYSYYLLHGLALKAGFLLFAMFLPPVAEHGPLFFAVLLPPLFAFTLVPTGALFLLVERPFSLAPARASRRPGKVVDQEAPDDETVCVRR